jgi:hypothetical protein
LLATFFEGRQIHLVGGIIHLNTHRSRPAFCEKPTLQNSVTTQ